MIFMKRKVIAEVTSLFHQLDLNLLAQLLDDGH